MTGVKPFRRRKRLRPSDEPDRARFHHLKLEAVYERNNFRVPCELIKVQCVSTAVPESQMLPEPYKL